MVSTYADMLRKKMLTIIGNALRQNVQSQAPQALGSKVQRSPEPVASRINSSFNLVVALIWSKLARSSFNLAVSII